MSTRLSSELGGILSSPRRLASAAGVHSRVYWAMATVSMQNGDGALSLYPLLRIPATALILTVRFATTGVAGATDCELGFWVAGDWTQATQAEIDGDQLVTGLDLSVGRDGSQDYLLGYNTITAPIWERAGLASAARPGTYYDLVWRAVVGPTGTANVQTSIEYAVGV